MHRLRLPQPPATNTLHACAQLLQDDPSVAMLSKCMTLLSDHGVSDDDLAVCAFHLMWEHRNDSWPVAFDETHDPFVAVALQARLMYLGAFGLLARYSTAARGHWGDIPALVAMHAASHLPEPAATQWLVDAAGTHPLFRDIAAFSFDRHPHQPDVMAAQASVCEQWAREEPHTADPHYHLALVHTSRRLFTAALACVDAALDRAAADGDLTEEGREWAEETYGDRREHITSRLMDAG